MVMECQEPNTEELGGRTEAARAEERSQAENAAASMTPVGDAVSALKRVLGSMPRVSFSALLADSVRERRGRLVPAAVCCAAAVCLLGVVGIAAAAGSEAGVSTRGFAAEVAGGGGVNAAFCRALDSSFLISQGGGVLAAVPAEGPQTEASLGPDAAAAASASGGDSALLGASSSSDSSATSGSGSASDASSQQGNATGASVASASAGGASQGAAGSSDSRVAAGSTAGASGWLTSGNYTGTVPTWSQNELGFYGGCEVVSATAMLVATGFDVTADDVADHLEFGSDFATHYVGDPYYSGAGYPVAIADAMNATAQWAAADGTAGEDGSGETETSSRDSRASSDFSTATAGTRTTSSAPILFAVDEGVSLSDLAAIANHGVPCLVWITMYTEAPAWSGIWDGDYQWYDNEHCVVLVGGSADEGIVRVMDPIDGEVVERNWDAFEAIYEECGAMSVRAARE